MTPARPPKFDVADLALIETHPHSSLLEKDLVEEIRNYQTLLKIRDLRIEEVERVNRSLSFRLEELE